MKKILLQLDGDRAPSVFDAITAYDAGADVVLQHGGMDPGEVRDLVYGAMFTRGPKDLKNSAVFIGGIDVVKGEAMLREATLSFFGPLRVSVMLDANGCNTTATAAVVKIISAAPVKGERVVVLAGTGPVGQRAAVLFAKEGADVVLTSRTLERAQSTCEALQQRFEVRLTPAAAGDPESTRLALDGAQAVLCTGVEGVSLISEEMWRGHERLRVLGDVNAVPPLGIEGSKPTWDGEEADGKRVFGALAIGDLKMKVHRRCIQRLFEQNDLVLDVEEIEEIAKELV
jgi:siroheme synthase (precorrin-2 oxidase/ferrochelatase)